MPRSGRERDGFISMISLSTVRASPGRVGLGQASSPPRADEAAGNPRPIANGQLHGDGGHMPAAGREAAEISAFCGFCVQVERLRIELQREGSYLVGVEHMRCGNEAHADGEVFEIKRAVIGSVHGHLPASPQPDNAAPKRRGPVAGKFFDRERLQPDIGQVIRIFEAGPGSGFRAFRPGDGWPSFRRAGDGGS